MSKFVLTAQLQLQAPTNVGQVVSQIQNQLNNVNVQIQAQGAAQAISQVNQLTTATQQASNAATQLGKNFGLSIKRFAAFSIATRAVSLFTSTLSKAVSEAIAFERELLKISQVTGKTMSQLKGLTNEITRLSTGLGVSSTSLLGVSRILSQAGLSADETRIALDALAKSDLAPTFDDIGQTAEGVVAIFNQFQAGAEALESQLGAINAVAGRFAVEAGDLISVIRRTGGVFRAAGGDLNELIAIFTSVRSTTRESAESIATGLRTIFTRIQRPQTIEYLKQFGVELLDLEGKFVGPFEATRRLSEALAGLEQGDITFIQIAEELGGFRQIGKVIPLLQQFRVAQEAYAVAQGGANSLSEDAAKAQAALAVRITKVKEEFLALVRSISESKSFQLFANTALNLASALIKLADALKPVIPLLTVFAGIKLATGLGGFIKGVGAGIKTPKAFARGGVVPGSGNRDTVPAMLTPGEFVIRKSSVAKIGAGNLHAMNENKYAAGGIVHGGRNLYGDIAPDGRRIVGAGSSSKLQSVKKKKKKGFGYDVTPGTGNVQFDVNPGAIAGFALQPAKGSEASYTNASGTDFIISPNSKAFNRYGPLIAKQSGSSFPDDFSAGIRAKINPATYPVFLPGQEEGRANLSKTQQYASVVSEAFNQGISSAIRYTVEQTQSRSLLDIPPAINSNENLLQNTISEIQNDSQVRSAVEGYIFEGMISALTGASLSGGRANFDIDRSTMSAYRTQLTALFGSAGQMQKVIKGEIKRSQDGVSSIPNKLANDIIDGNISGVRLKTLGKRQTNKYFGGLIEKFATGGEANGTDTVPALLTPGEFVVNKAAAQRIGYGSLNRMNKVAKYAKGGVVSDGVQRFFVGGVAEKDSQRAQGAVLTSLAQGEKTFNEIVSQLPKQLQDSILRGFQGVQAVKAGESTTTSSKAFTEGTRGQASFNGRGQSSLGLQIQGAKVAATTETVAHETGHLADMSLGGGKGLASQQKGTFQFDLVEKVKPQMEAAFKASGMSADRIKSYLASNEELFAEFFAKASPEVRSIITSTTDSKRGMEQLKQHLVKAGHTYAGLEASDIDLSLAKTSPATSKTKPSSQQAKGLVKEVAGNASINKEIQSLGQEISKTKNYASMLGKSMDNQSKVTNKLYSQSAGLDAKIKGYDTALAKIAQQQGKAAATGTAANRILEMKIKAETERLAVDGKALASQKQLDIIKKKHSDIITQQNKLIEQENAAIKQATANKQKAATQVQGLAKAGISPSNQSSVSSISSFYGPNYQPSAPKYTEKDYKAGSVPGYNGYQPPSFMQKMKMGASNAIAATKNSINQKGFLGTGIGQGYKNLGIFQKGGGAGGAAGAGGAMGGGLAQTAMAATMAAASLQAMLPPIDENSSSMTLLSHSVLGGITQFGALIGILQALVPNLSMASVKAFAMGNTMAGILGPIAVAAGAFFMVNKAGKALVDGLGRYNQRIATAQKEGDVAGAGAAAEEQAKAYKGVAIGAGLVTLGLLGIAGVLGPLTIAVVALAAAFAYFSSVSPEYAKAQAEAAAQQVNTQKALKQATEDATQAMKDFQQGNITAADAVAATAESGKALETQKKLNDKAEVAAGNMNPLAKWWNADKIAQDKAARDDELKKSRQEYIQTNQPAVNALARSTAAGGGDFDSFLATIKDKNKALFDALTVEGTNDLKKSFENIAKEVERAKKAVEAMSLRFDNVSAVSGALTASMSNYMNSQEAGYSALENTITTLEAGITSAAQGLSGGDWSSAVSSASDGLRQLGGNESDIKKFEENINAINTAQKSFAEASEAAKQKFKDDIARGVGGSGGATRDAVADAVGNQLDMQGVAPEVKQRIVDSLKGAEMSEDDLAQLAEGNMSVLNKILAKQGEETLNQVLGPLKELAKYEQQLTKLTQNRLQMEDKVISAQKNLIEAQMEAADIMAKYGGAAFTPDMQAQGIIAQANIEGAAAGISPMMTGSAAELQARSAQISAGLAQTGGVRAAAAAGDKGAQKQLAGQSGANLEAQERRLQALAKSEYDTTKRLIGLKETELKQIAEKNKLEKASIDALVTGDINKFFEQQAAVGARAAIGLGSSRLQGAYGADALGAAAQDIQRLQEAGVQTLYGQQISGPGGLAEQGYAAALSARGVTGGAALNMASVAAGTTGEEESIKSEIRDLASTLPNFAAIQLQTAQQDLEVANIQEQAAQMQLAAAKQNAQANGVKLNQMARGGMVYANRGMFIPRGTDTVPAMLTPGEFVVRREAVRRGNNLQLLQSMNKGQSGVSNSGGAVAMSNGGPVRYRQNGSTKPESGGGNFGLSVEVVNKLATSLNSFNSALSANIEKLNNTNFHIKLDTSNVNVNLTGGSFLAKMKDEIQSELLQQIASEISNYRVGQDGKLQKSGRVT